MKAVHSEEYFVKYWNHYMAPVPGEWYVNLEKEFNRKMEPVYSCNLPEYELGIIGTSYAEEIARDCEVLCRKMMKIWKDLESGVASFGYTTTNQEVSARKEFLDRFEFNCLQLKYFKRDHRI